MIKNSLSVSTSEIAMGNNPIWKEWIDKKSDMHNHSIYSDGKNTPEEIILSAIDKGIEVVGISDHAPVPFKEVRWCVTEDRLSHYLKEILFLKNKYQNQIKVLCGMEIDYFVGCEEHLESIPWNLLDYTIGSVHFFSIRKANGSFFGIDSSSLEFSIAILSAGSVQKICEDYFSMVVKAAESGYFTFIGHFDLIKKFNFNNLYFSEDEPWYQDMSREAMAAVAKTGIPIEINTSAKRKGHGEFYPSSFLQREAKLLGIPTFINSDSHNKDDVGFGRDDLSASLPPATKR